jgi:hypothetical protein
MRVNFFSSLDLEREGEEKKKKKKMKSRMMMGTFEEHERKKFERIQSHFALYTS